MPARGRWSGGPRDERAVFSPEIGPPISRRRTTGETRAFEATFANFTGAMRASFEAWFRDHLQGGVKRFSWRDPVSDEIALWQIVSGGDLAYSFTAQGADRHQLSLNLLRMPGTPWWAPYALAGDNRAPYAVADYAGSVFGVEGARSTAAEVAAVAGTFDVYTTDGSGTTAELNHVLIAGDIPATAPGTITLIRAFVPE